MLSKIKITETITASTVDIWDDSVPSRQLNLKNWTKLTFLKSSYHVTKMYLKIFAYTKFYSLLWLVLKSVCKPVLYANKPWSILAVQVLLSELYLISSYARHLPREERPSFIIERVARTVSIVFRHSAKTWKNGRFRTVQPICPSRKTIIERVTGVLRYYLLSQNCITLR